MTLSPNSIVLDGYEFEPIDPAKSKDCIKTHEEFPHQLSYEKKHKILSPPSDTPTSVLPMNYEVAHNDSSTEASSTEVKYAFLRCLRKLVQTPGLVSWTSNEDIENIFSFSGVKNTEKAMTKAGFKTNRFDSLKRQMNAYGFKFIHACDEHDGAWYHPSSNFGLTGERDHAIIPRGKNRKSSSGVVEENLCQKDVGEKRSSVSVHQGIRKISKRATKPPRRFSAKLGGGEHLDFSDEGDDAHDDGFHYSTSITRGRRPKVPVSIRLGKRSFRSNPAVAIMPGNLHCIPIGGLDRDPGVEASTRNEIYSDFRAMEQLETSTMFQHAYDLGDVPLQHTSKTSHTGNLISEYDNESVPRQSEAKSGCNYRNDEMIIPSDVSFEESLDFFLDTINRDVVEEVQYQPLPSGVE